MCCEVLSLFVAFASRRSIVRSFFFLEASGECLTDSLAMMLQPILECFKKATLSILLYPFIVLSSILSFLEREKHGKDEVQGKASPLAESTGGASGDLPVRPGEPPELSRQDGDIPSVRSRGTADFNKFQTSSTGCTTG